MERTWTRKANLFLIVLIFMCVLTASNGESVEASKGENEMKANNETTTTRQQWKRAPLTVVDAFYAGIAFVYLLFFGLGTWKNISLSKRLGQLLSSCASTQFAWIGVDKYGKELYQDGIANYIFYASGRRNISWLQCEIELKHRQDPFFYFRRPFENKWNMSDRLHIRVALSKDNLAPSVFCLIKARGARRFRSEHKDVENYCESFSSFLPTLNISSLEKFELFSESLELAKKLLAEDRMLQILKKYGLFIQHIYVSEETKSNNENETVKKYIDIQTIIPNDLTAVQDLLLLACWLSDHVSSLQLSSGVIQRSEKLRALVKEDEEKALEKKRKEQILKEKQERKHQNTSDVFSLSRSAQKKLEEKQRKAELRKKSKKGQRFIAI